MKHGYLASKGRALALDIRVHWLCRLIVGRIRKDGPAEAMTVPEVHVFPLNTLAGQ